MSTSEIQYLTPFFKIYKRSIVIITKKLYHKLGIVNGNIGYIKKNSSKDIESIQKNITMHTPIKILINFNEFIKKIVNL